MEQRSIDLLYKKGKGRQGRQGRQGCFFPKLQRLDPRDYEMINDGLAENTRVAPPNNQSKSHRVCVRTRKDVAYGRFRMGNQMVKLHEYPSK